MINWIFHNIFIVRIFSNEIWDQIASTPLSSMTNFQLRLSLLQKPSPHIARYCPSRSFIMTCLGRSCKITLLCEHLLIDLPGEIGWINFQHGIFYARTKGLNTAPQIVRRCTETTRLQETPWLDMYNHIFAGIKHHRGACKVLVVLIERSYKSPVNAMPFAYPCTIIACSWLLQ